MIYHIIIFILTLFILNEYILNKNIKRKIIYKPQFDNISYLNHDFSNSALYECNMRKCKKCGVLGYYHSFGPRVGKVNTIDPSRISGETYPLIILTCEEYIIKNLIE